MKIREYQQSNYKAIFFNGKTIRQKLNYNLDYKVTPTPEIEDVAINSLCYANCSYCYTSATKLGFNFTNIVDKAKETWGSLPENERPFQIAIGGAGESTIHPDWINFVKTVNQLGIVPNYTTNGMHLSDEIIEATKQYCGGVAVSYHPHISNVFHKAVNKLITIKNNIKLNAHIIIGEKGSLNTLKDLYEQYNEVFDYFVILPYQAVGRGIEIDVKDEWINTFEWINTVKSNKFAFGALFYEWLKNNKIELDMSIYEPEIFSGYRLFDDSYKTLRKSSYDLTTK